MIPGYDGVASRLQGLRKDRRGPYWTAKCPAHDDGKPSLRLWLGRRGQLMFGCWSGCRKTDILRELSLNWRDMWPQKGPQRTRMAKIVATYDYFNADGELVCQTVRWQPKGFTQRRPGPAGDWIWNLDGVDRVLYRLPELIELDDWELIAIVEGEKDADNLHLRTGMPATCNVGGAGKWEESYSRTLVENNLRPAIFAHNDKAGREHALRVAGSLAMTGCRQFAVVELPGLVEGGDVSDWLRDYPLETPAEEIRASLLDQIYRSRIYTKGA